MKTTIEINEPHRFLATAGTGNWIQALVCRDGGVHLYQQSNQHSVCLSPEQAATFAKWLIEA